jgi:hypothetical protein
MNEILAKQIVNEAHLNVQKKQEMLYENNSIWLCPDDNQEMCIKTIPFGCVLMTAMYSSPFGKDVSVIIPQECFLLERNYTLVMHSKIYYMLNF